MALPVSSINLVGWSEVPPRYNEADPCHLVNLCHPSFNLVSEGTILGSLSKRIYSCLGIGSNVHVIPICNIDTSRTRATTRLERLSMIVQDRGIS